VISSARGPKKPRSVFDENQFNAALCSASNLLSTYPFLVRSSKQTLCLLRVTSI
jgi:hypothetical protein